MPQYQRPKEWEAAIAEALLRAGAISTSSINPDIQYRARILAGAAMGVVRATLKHWRDSDCKGNLRDFAEEGLQMLENGVGRTLFMKNSAA